MKSIKFFAFFSTSSHSLLGFCSHAMADNKIFQFKLVLLGESAVGKSSLVLRFVKGQFLDFQESTIGAAFLTQTVCLNDTTVKFEIWDTAGQERYVPDGGRRTHDARRFTRDEQISQSRPDVLPWCPGCHCGV